MTGPDLFAASSIAASLGAFGLAGAAAVVRRPRVPPALPATSDLGSESPAVANLLANAGRVTPEAVPATFLDLAARRLVAIEETSPGAYGCRLRSRPADPLTAYESRVLDLLQSKSSGGLVPAQALSTGPPGQAQRWFDRFRREVVAEARRLGVCEPRWPAIVRTLLGVLLVGSLLLLDVALDHNRSPGLTQVLAIALFVLAAVVIGNSFRDDAQIVTSAGLGSEARWLALRRYLHDDQVFATLPPTAVAVRDRYLAYGAALGVAAAAVRAIPMGAESDRWAWTRFGGQWRQVRVSYPRSWPPLWGAPPRRLAGRALRVGALGLVLFLLPSFVFANLLPNFSPRLETEHTAFRWIVLLAAVVTLAGAAMVAVGLWNLLVAVVGFVVRTGVTGEAIRLRDFDRSGVWPYLAVYTGVGKHVRAWQVAPALYQHLTEYEVVSVVVSPLFGYVHSAQRASAPAGT